MNDIVYTLQQRYSINIMVGTEVLIMQRTITAEQN